MGCCGNKREQWNRMEKQVSGRTLDEDGKRPNTLDNHSIEIAAESKRNEPKIFEYIGTGSLALTGPNTSSHYHFAFPGHRLEIAFEDSFAIMGEVDLKRV
jgi:hypothetical protein